MSKSGLDFRDDKLMTVHALRDKKCWVGDKIYRVWPKLKGLEKINKLLYTETGKALFSSMDYLNKYSHMIKMCIG